MTSDTVINILILILYIGMMVGMGIYSIRHTKTVDGFLLGGRGLGPWLSAFAYGTSFFSAVIFIFTFLVNNKKKENIKTQTLNESEEK